MVTELPLFKRKGLLFRLFRPLWVGGVIGWFSASGLYGQNSAAGSGGAFLRTVWSPRQAAMGDCGVSLPEAEMAWYYNPALLGFRSKREFASGYRSLSLDRSQVYLDFSSPLSVNGGGGVGLMRAATDKVEIRDGNGIKQDAITISDNLIHGTFALKPAEFFSLGITIKWIIGSFSHLQINNKDLKAYGIGVDLGSVFRWGSWVLGAKVSDLGAHYNWDASQVWGDSYGAKDDPFPSTLRFGISYRYQNYLTIATELLSDITHQNRSSEAYLFKGGIEGGYTFTNGYRMDFRGGWEGNNPTLGLGLTLPLSTRHLLEWNYTYLFDRKNFNNGSGMGLRFIF